MFVSTAEHYCRVYPQRLDRFNPAGYSHPHAVEAEGPAQEEVLHRNHPIFGLVQIESTLCQHTTYINTIGIFVITAAIIRAVLTLSGTPSAQKINEWGIRETIIGIITVNVPVLRPFFTAAFWRWGPYDPHGSSRMTNSTEGRSKQTRTGNKDQYQSQIVTGKGDIEMGIMTVRPMGNGGSPSSSQENILLKDDKVYDVVVETSYAITSSEREEEAQMGRYNSIGVPH